jgi:four helix bundle protein
LKVELGSFQLEVFDSAKVLGVIRNIHHFDRPARIPWKIERRIACSFFGMKRISEARKRTLAPQQRALRFSTGVNVNCPKHFTSIPSETVWRQLVRAADSVSNNLCEADDAASTADFIHKIRLTLREAKESRVCLEKLRRAETGWTAKREQRN